MNAEPQKEHHWLQKLVGDWTYEMEASMAPGKPPEKFTGSECVRSLGGLWVMCEGRGKMPDGSPATTMMTLGYDPKKKRYQGTFIGSMMTHLWIYDGSVDPAGRVLTLNAEGPSFADEGKMSKYQDIIEFRSEDHRVLSSQSLGDDGTWHRFMTSHYRRTKGEGCGADRAAAGQPGAGSPVVHWELWTKSPGKVSDFYRRVFNWNVHATPGGMDYHIVDTGAAGGINGGIMTPPQKEPWPGNMSFYIAVDDLAAYRKRVADAGGKILLERQEVPGMGSFSLFSDPDGRVIGLWKQGA